MPSPVEARRASRIDQHQLAVQDHRLRGQFAEGLTVSSETLLDVLLDQKVRVGTSTPKADPAGDYAFALFARAEAVKAGAKAMLVGKALQLTAGSSSSKPPEGRSAYAWVMAQDFQSPFEARISKRRSSNSRHW